MSEALTVHGTSGTSPIGMSLAHAGSAEHAPEARTFEGAPKGFAAVGLAYDAAEGLSPQAAIDRAADAGAFLEMQALGAGAIDQAALKRQMNRFLDGLQYEFGVVYAPANFKNEMFGWSVQKAFDDARARVAEDPEITVGEFRKILKDIITSTRDYHVSIRFHSSARASLPLAVRGAGEGVDRRYFLAHVDRTHLGEGTFPYTVGTEIVAFDGRPIGEVIAALRAEGDQNTPETDQAMAEMALTRRSGANGQDVPKGPVTITLKLPSGKTVEHQLIWNRELENLPATPELGVTHKPHELLAAKTASAPVRKSPEVAKRAALLIESAANNMLLPRFDPDFSAENPFALGARRSFVPRLGEVVAEPEEEGTFDWYIYTNEQGQKVGVVRIPSYTPEDPSAAVLEFALIMARMEAETDGLVIDQVNNPGGSVFYLYALASLLTDKALPTPRHRMSITPEEVASAVELEAVASMILGSKQPERLAQALLGEDVHGYPVNAQFLSFVREYARFIQSEYRRLAATEVDDGILLTEPSHIFGVDAINPYPVPEARYTKPIVFLTNEGDFSGGDFMPSILQDNGRAVIFGNRTAGAGGYVRKIESSNLWGVASIGLTGSLAERPTGQPLENLGVTPDVHYEITPEDLQNGFEGYAAALNETVARVISEAKSREKADAKARVRDAAKDAPSAKSAPSVKTAKSAKTAKAA